MKKFFNVKTIAGLGILTALVVVLQLIANYISFGPVSITLALIPVVVGACMYGPLGGLFLGIVDGIIIIFAPSTFGFFIPQSVAGTIVTCIVKTGIAGLLAGLLFKLLEKKHPYLGAILAAIIVPIVNTGLFVVFCEFFFMEGIKELATDSGKDTVEFLFLSFIGINFIIEFVVNSVLSPTVYTLYKIISKKN